MLDNFMQITGCCVRTVSGYLLPSASDTSQDFAINNYQSCKIGLPLYSSSGKIILNRLLQIQMEEVAVKLSKSSNYYIKVDGKYHNISKYLDEVIQYLNGTIKTQMDLVILDEKIEKIRAVLNKLVNSKTNLHKHDLIVKTSKLLDELLVVYYYNRYE